jgi:hypothetical protein
MEEFIMSIAIHEASTKNVVRLKLGDRTLSPQQVMEMMARSPDQLARAAANGFVIQGSPHLIDTLRASGFDEIVKPTGEVVTQGLLGKVVAFVIGFVIGAAVGYALGSSSGSGAPVVQGSDDGQHAGDTGDGPRDGDSGDGSGGSGDSSGSSGGGGSGG